MARILTGIQSTGIPHLGNILGAIEPAVKMSAEAGNDSLFFIADLHSLTTIKDAKLRVENIRSVAATWLAFGFDIEKNVFYRQSDVPEVCELTWYLNCFTPFPMLANAHSFKDKSERLADVNAGLFTYPVLMAADILLYDAEVVPVGKDQLQHLEMTRDIARSFNHHYGEVFVIPEPKISEEVMVVPGIDGQKMSKSYNNYIDIFLPEKQLKKKVMSVITDSLQLEDPKNPETCNVFALYRLLAEKDQIEDMANKYRAGGYGYGHAKTALFEVIMDNYKTQREDYHRLVADPDSIDSALKLGAEKARNIATPVLEKVRTKLGY